MFATAIVVIKNDLKKGYIFSYTLVYYILKADARRFCAFRGNDSNNIKKNMYH